MLKKKFVNFFHVDVFYIDKLEVDNVLVEQFHAAQILFVYISVLVTLSPFSRTLLIKT